MQKDTEILSSYIQQLYAEKDPSKILSLFKELASSLSMINTRDNMKLTIIHHFCILADKLIDHPDKIKEILSVLLNAGKSSAPQYFSSFLASTQEQKPQSDHKNQLKVFFLRFDL